MTTTQPQAPSSAVTDDAESFGAWYREHWPRVANLAGHLLGNRVEGEDLASDVLLRVWSRWRMAGPPDNPQAYLHRAVNNEVATRLRRSGAERRALSRMREPVATNDTDASILDRAQTEWLLQHLGPVERQTVVWHYLEDRSCTDIASQTGLAVSSIRSRLHRGRRRLAEAITA
jgi:RNA polymerase sigma-70 factor (ECF subfamily)